MRETYNFFVSTGGNDEWSGELDSAEPDMTDGPFGSLDRARRAFRELKSGGLREGAVNVFVRGGLHVLDRPLVFSGGDSGSGTLSLSYRAYGNEKPVISGGKKIESWESAGGGLWHADASGLAAADGACRQLFIDGKRKARAGMPLEGFYFTDGPLPAAGEKLKFHFSRGDLKKEWADEDSDMLILEKWFELRHRVESIDEKNSESILAGSSRTTGLNNLRYRLENVREGLDAPGTWFYDRVRKMVFYRPLPGEDMRSAEAVVPRLGVLADFRGEARGGESVKNIHFSGLTFSHTAWMLPEDGYNDMQAAHDIPAAVRLSGSQECGFENCRFIHLGGYGIEFGRGCKNNFAAGCEISDAGAGGVKIGSPDVYEDQSDPRISGGNRVEECSIHNIGNVYPAGVGVWIGQSRENKVSHNHIYNTFYSGISAGWTWGYGASNARGNLIEHNHLHDISRGMLCDLGGIYTLGVQPGTVIRGNLIHDVESYRYGGHGIYLDEGTSGVLVENNIAYKTGNAFYQHYGRENVIRNNIFAFSKSAEINRKKEEEHISFVFQKNIVYSCRGPLLGGSWNNNKYRLDENVYFFKEGTADDFCESRVYTGIKALPGTPGRESANFDAVRLEPGSSREPVSGGMKILGTVPEIPVPREEFPEDNAWSGALTLPEMTGLSGGKLEKAGVKTHILRDKSHVFVRFLCGQSAYFQAGVPGDSEKYERVDLFIKPVTADAGQVHLALTVEGAEFIAFHPRASSRPVCWKRRLKRAGEGWEALFKIRIDDIGAGKDGLWQLFAGHFRISRASFSEWRESGQDSRSIFADPMFTSPGEGDFRLREGTPALKFFSGNPGGAPGIRQAFRRI